MRYKDFFDLRAHLSPSSGKDVSKPAAVYFLYGTESYIETLALQLIAQAVKKQHPDLIRHIFFGDEGNWGSCWLSLKSFSFTHQLILLKRAEHLKANDWQQLAEYCQKPNPGSSLVVVATKIDKRKKALTQILKHTHSIELKTPVDRDLPMWLQFIARRLQLQLPPSLTPVLCNLLGSNLSHMHNELLKLAGLEGVLDKNKVLEVLTRRRVDGVFEFTNALGQKNKLRALVLLDNLLQHGQSELGVLALTLRHFRILLATLDGLQQGLQGAGLAKHIQVPVFFLQQYVEQARHWSYAQLNKSLMYVYEVDKRIKSSPLPARLQLEALVLNLHPSGDSSRSRQ